MCAERKQTNQLWIPVAGSLAVYLTPLVGPHAVWLLGESLVQAMTRANERGPRWLAADVTLALAAQLAVGLLLAWSLRGSRVRLLVWIAAIPLLVAGLNAVYLVAIPSYFLIEGDTRPELTNWQKHCLVPRVSLMPIRTSVKRPTEVREWWMQRPDASYALLRLPECALVDAKLPVPTITLDGRVDFMIGFQFSAAGGAAILERLVPSTSARTWWLLTGPSSALQPIERTRLIDQAPILSDQADALAWLQPIAGSGPPVLQRLIVRPVQPSSSLEGVEIDLTPFGPASYTLIGVDTASREAILWRTDHPLVIGFDGRRREYAFTAGPIRAQPSSFLRHRDGWVAWDAYRDDGPYQITWSLAAGSGNHRTNKGRNITSAAVDPSGSLIAISESTTLSIGNAPDVVYVIRTTDGSEVFRKYLSRYARSPVVFFEGGFFGYSDLEGTHILKIVQ